MCIRDRIYRIKSLPYAVTLSCYFKVLPSVGEDRQGRSSRGHHDDLRPGPRHRESLFDGLFQVFHRFHEEGTNPVSYTHLFGGYFKGVKDGMDVAVNGIKAVLPAIMILALAYCINDISKTLGAQQFIISVTQGWMTAGMLPVVTFLTGALISFFTGTSWGTYAILTPFVLPLALNLSGGAINSVVLATVGAIVGGGCLGDHSSPVSDTTCLSSFGAASDHMEMCIRDRGRTPLVPRPTRREKRSPRSSKR